MQRAFAEMALLGVAGGALGCWVVLYELSYAAESLAHSIFPGLVIAALAGVPLLLGAAPAIVLAALAIAVVSPGAGGQPRHRVAVVVTTLFGARRAARALAGLAAGDRDPALRRHPRPHRRRPARRRRRWSLVCRRRSALLHGRLLAPGFDRGVGARARRSRRRSPTRRCWSCSRPRSSSPSRASATCSSSPSSSARRPPPASSPTGSCR